MNIVIDNIVFKLQGSGGVSIVWYEFLKRILSKNYNLEFVEYKNTSDNIFRSKLDLSDFKLVYPKFLLFNLARYRDVHLKKDTSFIFHSSYYRICSNKKAINITTVHDFTYEYFTKGLKRYIHCWQKHRAIKKSAYIICISENSKRDLLKFISGIDPNKIRVIYNGVSNEYMPINSSKYIKELNPFKSFSYILFVGGRRGYKNFDLAVKAISKTDFNLVIVGSQLTDEDTAILNKYMDKSRYCNKIRITNIELNNLYNQAFCLLYPSSYEGFGIPVIESQRAGCPVIAYNNSSIPEIIGNTPLLIENLTVNDVIEKIELLKSTTVRKMIIADGLINSQRFSWDLMTDKVLELYELALNTNH